MNEGINTKHSMKVPVYVRLIPMSEYRNETKMYYIVDSEWTLSVSSCVLSVW